jgi:hypothetical protein
MLETHGEVVGSSGSIDHTFSRHDLRDCNNTGRELQLEHFVSVEESVDQVLASVLVVSGDAKVLLRGGGGISHTAQVELDWTRSIGVGGSAGPAL